MRTIDLRSDTLTQPGKAMREAMASAPVGDDGYGEDPTVNRLQVRVAERLGKEAGLFVPSGLMANQIALRLHTRPGDVVVTSRDAHLVAYEVGAAAALGGVQINELGADGRVSAADLNEAIPLTDMHRAGVRLLSLENTHNFAGGRVVPVAEIEEVVQVARRHGLVAHLDGARLFNAEVATGVPVHRWAYPFDSVCVCLSKGLGAPVGSVLCGSAAFVAEARVVRKRLGGAMRQVGILAAAGIYALDHNLQRLADDHHHASILAAGLRQRGFALERPPETNIVLLRVDDAPAWVDDLARVGVRMAAISPTRLRAVTHLGVDADDVAEVLRRVEAARRPCRIGAGSRVVGAGASDALRHAL